MNAFYPISFVVCLAPYCVGGLFSLQYLLKPDEHHAKMPKAMYLCMVTFVLVICWGFTQGGAWFGYFGPELSKAIVYAYFVGVFQK